MIGRIIAFLLVLVCLLVGYHIFIGKNTKICSPIDSKNCITIVERLFQGSYIITGMENPLQIPDERIAIKGRSAFYIVWNPSTKHEWAMVNLTDGQWVNNLDPKRYKYYPYSEKSDFFSLYADSTREIKKSIRWDYFTFDEYD